MKQSQLKQLIREALTCYDEDKFWYYDEHAHPLQPKLKKVQPPIDPLIIGNLREVLAKLALQDDASPDQICPLIDYYYNTPYNILYYNTSTSHYFLHKLVPILSEEFKLPLKKDRILAKPEIMAVLQKHIEDIAREDKRRCYRKTGLLWLMK